MTEERFYPLFRDFWDKQATMDPALKPFAIELEPTYHFVKPWETPTNHPAVQETVRTMGQYTGREPKVGGAPLSCDMAVYGEAGIPTVILGPRGDNLHAPDEWVLVEDILTLTGAYAWLACQWCG